MKKTLFFMVTGMLLMLMATAAMAQSVYTPITEFNINPAPTHTLTLDDSDSLLYDIIYKFSVGSAEILTPTSVITGNIDYAVEGKPAIGDLEYNSSSTFVQDTDGKYKCTQNLNISWNGVKIKEPGIYRWEVTKTVPEEISEALPQNVTNYNEKTYIYAYVTANGNTLALTGIGFTLDQALTEKENIGDVYPASVADLSLSKNVTGNQGSRDQYFKFTIKLTAPEGTLNHTYTISDTDGDNPTFDKNVPKTAYNAQTSNQTTVEFSGTTPGEVTIWLKHGQKATIKGLPWGTKYEITEDKPNDYTASAKINGIEEISGAQITERDLKADTDVVFTNNKEATPPTGIRLENTSAVVGILIALSLPGLLFIGRRKENN